MKKLRLRGFKYFPRGHPARMKDGKLVQMIIPNPGLFYVQVPLFHLGNGRRQSRFSWSTGHGT